LGDYTQFLVIFGSNDTKSGNVGKIIVKKGKKDWIDNHSLLLAKEIVIWPIPPIQKRSASTGMLPTNHVERFNPIFRPRISRLMRKSLSFFRNVENSIGAIWYFIHDDNARLAKL
jgi:hypothetical protein